MAEVFLSTNALFSEWCSPRNPSLLKLGDRVGIRGRRWRLVLREAQVCYLEENERVFHWGEWWMICHRYGLVWLVRVGETRAPLGGMYGRPVWIDSETKVQELVLQRIGE